MKIKLILLLLIILSSCKSEKNEVENLTEVLKLNDNQNLMKELRIDNDSVSFGWTYNYNLSGKQIEINIKIYNDRKIDSLKRRVKLENDSKKIISKLDSNLKDLSNFDKLNFYQISNNKMTDSLKINVNDL